VSTISFAASTVFLLDANAPMEVGWCQNGNGGLLGQNQQILITCHQGISFAGNCQFEKYLVVFVAANGYRLLAEVLGWLAVSWYRYCKLSILWSWR
jgi:hypothetical protein